MGIIISTFPMGKVRFREKNLLMVELKSEHFKDRVLFKHAIPQVTSNSRSRYCVLYTCYVPRALHELTLTQNNLWV